jgi:cell division septal protein FtsQ
MQIKTTKTAEESEAAQTTPDPDQIRYLRRNTAQKLWKSHRISFRLSAALPGIGRAGFLLLVVAFLFSVLNFAYTSENFKLQKISFEGCHRLDTQPLDAAIRQAFPPNILMIDLYKLRSLLEARPWTRRAEIRRILPSSLAIRIEERVPTVIFEINGELMIADEEGILLDKYDPKYGKLDVPVFKGLLGENAENYRLYQEENSSRVRRGRQMLEELDSGSPLFTRSISEVDLSDKDNLKITLIDETAEIYLGDRDFLTRYRNLLSNMSRYQELKSQYNEIASVDLRFDGQIIYRPQSPVVKKVEDSTVGSQTPQ